MKLAVLVVLIVLLGLSAMWTVQYVYLARKLLGWVPAFHWCMAFAPEIALIGVIGMILLG